MNRSMRRRLLPIAGIVAAAVVLAGGCSLPFEWAGAMPGSWGGGAESDPAGEGTTTSDEPRAIQVAGPSFTLAWDDEGAQVDSYNVYLRPYGTAEWQLLAGNVVDPSVEVTENDLGYGSYEFAVASIAGGVESELHHSFDQSADPEPWYLEWSAG